MAQEMPQELIVEGYKFSEGTVNVDTVTLKVTTYTLRYTQDHLNQVTDIMKNLGKWEGLIKTGLDIFAELGLGQPSQTTLDKYEKPFGIELYDSLAIEIDNRMDSRCLWVSISLTDEERQKRQNAEIRPIIQLRRLRVKFQIFRNGKTLKWQ